MARKLTEWPSNRGPITKIMPSDGCKGNTVPLAVGKRYNFHEFGGHLGNVGLTPLVATVFKHQLTERASCFGAKWSSGGPSAGSGR